MREAGGGAGCVPEAYNEIKNPHGLLRLKTPPAAVILSRSFTLSSYFPSLASPHAARCTLDGGAIRIEFR